MNLDRLNVWFIANLGVIAAIVFLGVEINNNTKFLSVPYSNLKMR